MSTASSVALTGATITITGSVLGMGYGDMIAAFAGCMAVVTMFNKELPVWKLIVMAVGTVFLSAWAAPVVAAYAAPKIGQDVDSLHSIVAALLGAGIPVLLPAVIVWLAESLKTRA